MTMNRSTQLVAALLACSQAAAFVPYYSHAASSLMTHQRTSSNPVLQMTMTDGFPDDEPVSTVDIELPKKTMAKKSSPKMSQAIPFLKRPPMLTGEMAGDFGFDPLGYAKDRDTLFYYREMEVKHARLAMLAAAGWPISELLDRPIAKFFGIPSVLDDHDRVPSILNGGLGKVSPEFWGFCLGLCAAIDSYQNHRARSNAGNQNYSPGDLGWDPLNMAQEGTESRKTMQLAEIQNGRLAMLGVTGFAVQEAVGGQGVIDETPIFFQPLTETVELILKGLLE